MSEDLPLLVACLCAEWCGTCREYRATFDALASQFAGRARFAWVDIEDEDEVVGDELDIENFPTLLIARGTEPLFYGTVLPHVGTASAMVERALRGELGRVAEPAVAALAARVREHASA